MRGSISRPWANSEVGMSGTVKALVSADQPLIRIYGGDGEYAEIQFETQDDANVAVERFNEVLKKATGIVFTKGPFT
jgi:hypothetical protein